MAEKIKKQELKRYLVFAFQDYYPTGGLSDVKASVDTIEEVQHLFETYPIWVEVNKFYDNYEVFDCEERRTLSESEYLNQE